MGKYDGAAKRAAEDVMKEFEGDIKALKTSNLDKMFPVPADRKLMNELIAKIDKATSRNELVTSIQILSAKMTADGVRVLKDSFNIAKKLLV